MAPKGLRALLVGLVLSTVLLAGCGPQATPTPAATPTPLPPTATPTPTPRTISGQLTYSGRITDRHQIIIVVGRAGESGPPAYSAVIPQAGPYTIANVADGAYTIMAFMDTGDDMGPPQPNEPQGGYDPDGDGKVNSVMMSGGKALTGINIVLSDPK